MRTSLTRLCAFLCLSTIAYADVSTCRLLVNDESKVAGPWPLVGGLPLPKGAVTDPMHIRVVDAQGREVPAQVDIAATYKDGSIRWALVSFVGPTDGDYRAEFGAAIRRAPAKGMAVTERDGQVLVDTDAARFTVTKDNLLVDSAVLTGERAMPLWAAGEQQACLVDNQGRRAVCAGQRAEIELRILKAGPLRCVLRTEGWYVTDQGERVARGIARMTFFAGTAVVEVSHTLVFTEDTNRLWVRDYGIETRLRAGGTAKATFDVAREFDMTAHSVALKPGEAARMMQDDFPHFAERNSHFSLSLASNGKVKELASGEACGEWCDLSSDGVGLTVVVRELAEQFPKELEVVPYGIRVHLWPARSGKELDFRAATLVKDYWAAWANLAPGGAEALMKVASNAQAAGKTHEIVLMPHAGPLDVAMVASHAHAVCKPVLLLPDPTFTCATGALTWPLHPRDTERFPAEEAMISDFFDRTVLPFRVFPMTGVIAWGCNPYLNYTERDGKWFSEFYRVSQMVDYGVRRHVWNLYARSGERKYFEYGRRFNRFAADWEMAHWTAGDRIRGGFAVGDIHKPFYWGTKSMVLASDISGHDISNWLLEYYLTGNERALEPTREFGEAVKKHWDLEAARKGSSPFLILRVLAALYTREWDDEFRRMAHDLAHRLMDMNSPNGLTNEMPYGAMYKVDRNASALYDYWWATGDELAKQVFLKAMDYQYRFNRIPPPISYQNGAAYLLTIAYEWTGREEYRRVAHQLVASGLITERTPLREELDSDPNATKRLPYRGVHLNMHPLLGMPTALTLLAKAERPIPPFPMLAKSAGAEEGFPVFEKARRAPVQIGMYVRTMRKGDVRPQIVGPDEKPVAASIQVEERMASYAPEEWRHLHFRMTIPAEAPVGIYRIDLERTDEFTVQDATVERMALATPDGFWVGLGTQGAVPLYFLVPPPTDPLKVFVGRPLRIYRPDGTVAVEAKDENIGEMSVPVNGQFGAWRVESPVPGHVKLRNVESLVSAGTPDRLLRTEKALPRPAQA